MDGHFAAFSFVDRIMEVEPGLRAQGRYAIPANLASFPVSLVAESVGQLAAWVAMAATDFQRRPVAGLAGRIEILSEVRPGQILHLGVELEHIDRDAMAYAGVARADGVVILRLAECVGPMLPAEDFDDPVALQDRFVVLCGPGSSPGGFLGVETLPFTATEVERGRRYQATLHVPASAPFFIDHFPRQPVLPGTLLLDALFRFARAIAPDLSPDTGTKFWTARKASDVKLRAFLAPGQTIDLEATLHEREPQHLKLRLGARAGKRSVASARVELMAGSVE
jgi:3-hydroxymyristoyl/3-hydroxydecanoyl-(acyl carrier protein) dehydratase